MEILILIIFTITSLVILAVYINKVHERKLPKLNIEDLTEGKTKTNVLFIFPHPDDETFGAGGLIAKLSKNGAFKLFGVSVTKGEHGDELLKLPPEELGKIRADEFSRVMKNFNVSAYELWDFPDGSVTDHFNNLKTRIINYVKENKVNLIVTYERTGVYPHQDHITLSRAVREVGKELNVNVLYATVGKKLRKKLNLPKTITIKDKVIQLEELEPDYPEVRLNVLSSTLTRYKAINTYKSQKLPKGIKALKYLLTFGIYEYYSTKYDLNHAVDNDNSTNLVTTQTNILTQSNVKNI